jgi:hypothetical protein
MTTCAAPPDAAPTHADLRRALAQELLGLASQHDASAAAEAARVPYWAPCPSTVAGHRAAAALLREDAERLALGRRS